MEENSLIGFLSVSTILISALVYYFGVLWGHTQVEDYNKADCYFAGVLFIIKYMLPSWVLILYIQIDSKLYEAIQNIQITGVLWLFVIIFIIFIQIVALEWISQKNRKYELRDKSKTYKDTSTILYLDVIKGMLSSHKLQNFSRRKAKFFENFPLLIVSNLTITIIYIFYILPIPKAIILLSFGIAFLTLTNIVFSIGHSEVYYPPVKIYLNDGYIVKGNILKFGSYISLLTDNKYQIKINKDNITLIEENKSKNNFQK